MASVPPAENDSSSGCGSETSTPRSAVGSNAFISCLPERRAGDLEGDGELALGVVAGHEQFVALVHLVMRETVGVDPAVRQLETDPVGSSALDGTTHVVHLGVADERDDRGPLLGPHE